MLQKQPRRLRARDRQRQLRRLAVFLGEARVRKARAAEHICAIGSLKRAEPVLPQQDALPILFPEARFTVFRQHGRAHLFAQFAGQGSVARDGVRIQNDLPVLAARIRTRARQTGKLVYIIKMHMFHDGTSFLPSMISSFETRVNLSFAGLCDILAEPIET